MTEKQYELILYDDFDDKQLNEEYWFTFYLPQWSSRKLSAPYYTIENSILQLYISNEQKPWCPEWNGNVRVSNIQTGVYSGPVGSKAGQHHFTKGLTVREEQEKNIKIALHYGMVEFRARCNLSKDNVAALWLIGIEEHSEESAEICLFELKGWNIEECSSIIGYGVHPFADSNLKDCFYEEVFHINVNEWNVYSFDWQPRGIDFYINGNLIRKIIESPDYPMQLMLNLYNLGNKNSEQSVFEVDYIKVSKLLDC